MSARPALLLILAALASGSVAAEVRHAHRPYANGDVDLYVAGAQCAIVLDGPLNQAAAQALDGGLREMQRQGCSRGTMVFNTAGGTPAVAYNLADFLHKNAFDTAVAEDGLCFSACAYAFLGGRRRHVADGGRYGVHQHTQHDGRCALELGAPERERLRGVVQRALPSPAAETLIGRVMATDCGKMDVIAGQELQTLAVTTSPQPLLAPEIREAMARRTATALAELRGSGSEPWRRLTGDARLTLFARGAPEAMAEGRMRLRGLVSHAAEDIDAATGIRYRSHLTLNEIDCERRTLQSLRSAYTRDAMGEGAVLRQNGRGAVQTIAAGTAAAVFYRAACGKALPVS